MMGFTGNMRVAGWVTAAVIWTTGICFAVPSAPMLTVAVSGTNVNLQWTEVDGAQGYNLYFAPYPGAAYQGNLDMGGATQVSFSLGSGAAFYVAVSACDGDGEGGFSNMEYFVLASGGYPVVDTGQTLFYGSMSQIPQPAEGDAFYGQDARYEGNVPSYTAGQDTVLDNVTGLTWTKSPDWDGDGDIDAGDKMSFSEAKSYPDILNAQKYGGYSDWRLPNAKEMQSIVDYTRAPDATGTAAIAPIFNTTQITDEAGETGYPWFWTGTTHKRANGSGEAGVYICFGRAMGYVNGKWMDVHGAGAQRSDRKEDDFSNFTYVADGWYFGKSPQGDATRIYNYVRLVRDVGN